MVSVSPLPTLAALLMGLSYRLIHAAGHERPLELPIATVVTDSRLPAPGALFVARPGTINDGHDYLEKAVAAGCTAVVCQVGRCPAERLARLDALVVEVDDSLAAHARISANYFGRPAEGLRLVGVTGTNGKTTVTYLLEKVLLAAGRSVGVIGTVNNRYTLDDGTCRVLDTRFTTPEAFTLQRVLRTMADAGVTVVVMEVSSHALEQGRVGGLGFSACAFTNLTRDHLDYHHDMDSYFQAKARLFDTYLRPDGVAVLPVVATEAPSWLISLHRVCREAGQAVVSWGEEEGAAVRLLSHAAELERSVLQLATASGTRTLVSPLVGRYNIDNLLVTYGLAMALGIGEDDIAAALATAGGAPGRLQRVAAGAAWPAGGPVVLVDYAHTPDALEKVLSTVKALPHGELYCVFGCGGDRDDGKRPLMGGIAASLADVVVVTDDNPRTEDPEKIVSRIVSGIDQELGTPQPLSWLRERSRGARGYVVERDRHQAIAATVRAAGQEDIVVIAGKGHEAYQLTLQGKRFFDDCLEAKNALLSWTDELVAAAAGGDLLRGTEGRRLLSRVLTDSRPDNAGGIFVALKGERHDAHDFLSQALARGAACLVAERLPAGLDEKDASVVIVADTERALGDLAAFRRRRLAAVSAPKVIAITGSCGKTTVKEMVAAILARRWPPGPDYPEDCVLKTQGNFNNLVGLPLSLLPLAAHHRAAVLEMGMNRPGELSRLAEIAAPDICCITNIHGAHLEGLGSIEGVARAKEELFAAAAGEATLIINLDDPRVALLAGKYPQKRLTFAVHAGQGAAVPDFYASELFFASGGAITFTLHHRGERVPVHLFTAGEHNVANALAAAAIAAAAGAGLAEIASGLGDYRPPAKRMEMLASPLGPTILNDSYNANPASMAAGLRTVRQLARGLALAIVGDMRELGQAAPAAHFEIGRLAGELSIDYLAVVGEHRAEVRRGAVSGGLPAERVRVFATKEEAASWVKELVAVKSLGKDDVILVKASRGLQFETITAQLMDHPAE